MEIMVVKPGYIEEVVKTVENVERKYCEKRYVAGVLTGVLIAKKLIIKKESLRTLF